ncbi:UNVERIFIED_CONTAM: hypothetical protein FKN15_044932 [Acipenser sinensis]
MWIQLKHIGSHCVITRVWHQHKLFRNYACLWRVSSRLRELRVFSNDSKRTHDSPGSFASNSAVNGNGLRERPPWRILFFGTDEFAVESLKALTLSRDSSPKTAVDTLEVVTLPAVLSKELPVRRFASQNELPIHDWPHIGPCEQFHDKCLVQPHCTAQELGATLAKMGAKMLISTLENLPERIQNKKEQSKQGATFAPKISVDMSWVNWEDQSCDQIGRLFQAIGSRDGWVGFKAVKLKKRLSAADFYNGYLHQYFLRKSERQQKVSFPNIQTRTQRREKKKAAPAGLKHATHQEEEPFRSVARVNMRRVNCAEN